MDQVLQLTGRLGATMVEFGNELNNALALLGEVTVLDVSLTSNAGVYTAVVSYRIGGLPVRAIGAQSPNTAVPSWTLIDAALQTFPEHYALFVRSVPPEDDRDLPPRQLLVVFSIGAPGVLPGNGTSLYIARALAPINAGAAGGAEIVDGFGAPTSFVVAQNASTILWTAGSLAYVYMDAAGVWTAFPRCC